jgi:hypothetical protein
MMRRILSILLFTGLIHFCANAQDVIRVGIVKADLSQLELKKSLFSELMAVDVWKPNALHTISDRLVNAYTNDPGFKVIDYRSYNLVTEERERQKDEAFIDGYIVEQGRSEGVNFILSPIYLVQENEITVRVIDVATGLVSCQATTPLVKNKTGPEYSRYYSALLTQQLNNRCFNLQYPVVRILKEKSGDAREVLVAFGSIHQAKEKLEVGIFKNVVENVNGVELDRQVQIAEGYVELVEGDNFSIITIKKGGSEITHAMASGMELSLRITNIIK